MIGQQIAMDFTARTRRTDPPTSRDAAGKVSGAQLADAVHADMLSRGPGTAHDIAERMGLSLVTVSPRMKPLEEAGRVVRGPKRDGRTVWIPI